MYLLAEYKAIIGGNTTQDFAVIFIYIYIYIIIHNYIVLIVAVFKGIPTNNLKQKSKTLNKPLENKSKKIINE